MKEKLTQGIDWVLGRNIKSNASEILDNEVPTSPGSAKDNKKENNVINRLKQLQILAISIVATVLTIGFAVLVIQKKTVEIKKTKEVEPVLTVELADQNLDPEKHWRNYFEDRQAQLAKDLEERIQALSEAQTEVITKTNQRIEEELASTKEKLEMAQRELSSASLDLQRVAKNEQNPESIERYKEAELGAEEFDSGVEFDKPKSAKNYIPEGTYFTGHLLGGIAVSTGLNAPDENATPVSIKLAGRVDAHGRATTNLSSLNKLELQNCRIMGSAYGDLSSERAIVRLEKMICERDGLYITSKIAGQIFGSDGLNGVKGTVISTSIKHMKNAAIGGLISGIGSAAKGQDGAAISGSGLIQTKTKGIKSLLGEGALQGASNAGDKIADYYLRQAEAMSPILTVPSGVRINTQITKGFFVGEISTHRKINAARSNNNFNANANASSNPSPSPNMKNNSNSQMIKSEYAE